MSPLKKVSRELIRYAETLGVEAHLEGIGKHYKYRLRYGDRSTMLVTPRTASCPYSLTKQHAFIRKFKELNEISSRNTNQ